MNEESGENALRRFSVEEMAKKVALEWVDMWKILSENGACFIKFTKHQKGLEPQTNEYRQEHRLGEFGKCQV